MPDDQKKTQGEVNYRKGDRPKICFECEHYSRPPALTCEKVEGRIVPGWVCDLYTPRA